MEKPVCFKVGNDVLFGILHIPQGLPHSEKPLGVLFITAGLRYRIGPYRQYVRFARRFCQAGFYVLRFDAPGIGDSEGHFKDLLQYRQHIVENPEITNNIIDFFMAVAGVDRVGLFGLCGGAYDALLTGAANPRVECLVLLSLPVELLDDTMPEGMGQFDHYQNWHSLADESSKAIEVCAVKSLPMRSMLSKRQIMFSPNYTGKIRRLRNQ
jgi:pimeloyl-ACP methyl ester carboxylesterase